MTRKRRALMPHVRRAVLDRDGPVCALCGASGPMHMDHIIPWSQRGPDASWNLRPLCPSCNLSRSVSWTPDDRTIRPPCAPRCVECADVTPTCWGWCTACHAYADIAETDVDTCLDPERCGCKELRRIIQKNRKKGIRARRRKRRAAA